MQIKTSEVFEGPDVFESPGILGERALAENLRVYYMGDSGQKQYQAGAQLGEYRLKKDVILLNPLTQDLDSKKRIRVLLEDYLEKAVPDFITTTDPHTPDPKRLLPHTYCDQLHYYFLVVPGFIRDRCQKTGHRIEFLDTLLGAGAYAGVYKTATLIFDEADSYTLITQEKKPRALKKVKVLHPHLLSYTNEILALFRFPYADYKLKACFYTQEQGQTYLYIPQRLIEGKSLFKFLKQHSELDATQLIDLATAVGHATQNVQQYHIIHRDLTPPNIMVTSSSPFTARVIDFGVAIFSETMPNSDLICGTYALAAPETIQYATYNLKTDEYTAILSMLYCFSPGMDLINHKDDKSIFLKAFQSKIYKQLSPALRYEIKQTFRAVIQDQHRASLQEVLDKLNACKLILLSNAADHPELLSLQLQYTQHLMARIKKHFSPQGQAAQITKFISFIMDRLFFKLPDNVNCLALLTTTLSDYGLPAYPSKAALWQQLLNIRTHHYDNPLSQLRQYIDLLYKTTALLPKKSRINHEVQQFQENNIKMVTQLLTKERDTLQTEILWLLDYDALELNKKLSILNAIYAIVLYRAKQAGHAFHFLAGKKTSQEKKYLYACLYTFLDNTISSKDKCMAAIAMIRSPQASSHFKALLTEEGVLEDLFIQLTGEDHATCDLAVQRMNTALEDQKKHTAKP